MAPGFSSHPPRDDLARQVAQVYRGCRGKGLADLVIACGGRYSARSFARFLYGMAKGLGTRELFGAFATGCAHLAQHNGVLEPGPWARQRFIAQLHDALDLAELRSEDLGLYVRRGHRPHRRLAVHPEFDPVRPCPADPFELRTVLRREEQARILIEWPFARVVVARLHAKDGAAALHAALMLLVLGFPDRRALDLITLSSVWAGDAGDDPELIGEVDELRDLSEQHRVNRCLALRAAEARADAAQEFGYHDARILFRDIATRLGDGDWTWLSAPVEPQVPSV